MLGWYFIPTLNTPSPEAVEALFRDAFRDVERAALVEKASACHHLTKPSTSQSGPIKATATETHHSSEILGSSPAQVTETVGLPCDSPDDSTDTLMTHALEILPIRPRGVSRPQGNVFLRFRVAGDEELPGTIFNYARGFTWWFLAKTILDTYATQLCTARETKRVDDTQNSQANLSNTEIDDSRNQTVRDIAPVASPEKPPMTQSPETLPHQNIFNKARESVNVSVESIETGVFVTQDAGYNVASPADYSVYGWKSWHEINDARSRMLKAFLAATFCHAVVAMATLLTAFYTGTVGFGCISLATCLYFACSFVAALFLLITAYLATILGWLEAQERGKRKTIKRNMIKIATILFRLAGKLLAFLNSFALLVHWVFIFTGMYGNCWCMSLHIEDGNKGYIWFVPDQYEDEWKPSSRSQYMFWGSIIGSWIIIIGYCIYFSLVRRISSPSIRSQ